jgi:hypothetical protein
MTMLKDWERCCDYAFEMSMEVKKVIDEEEDTEEEDWDEEEDFEEEEW